MFFVSQWWCIFCVLHPFRDWGPRTPSRSFMVVKSSQTTDRTLRIFSHVSVQFIVLISFLSGVTYDVLENCRHHWCPSCAHRDGPYLVQWGWFWWAACELLGVWLHPLSRPAWVTAGTGGEPAQACPFTQGSELRRTAPLATYLWVCFLMYLEILKNFTVVKYTWHSPF